MTAPAQPRDCRDETCGGRIILARIAGTSTWMPLDADDLPPFSTESTGCRVVVTGQAWLPADLIEDFQVRFEITREKARELVEGYPFHRPHNHEVHP